MSSTLDEHSLSNTSWFLNFFKDFINEYMLNNNDGRRCHEKAHEFVGRGSIQGRGVRQDSQKAQWIESCSGQPISVEAAEDLLNDTGSIGEEECRAVIPECQLETCRGIEGQTCAWLQEGQVHHRQYLKVCHCHHADSIWTLEFAFYPSASIWTTTSASTTPRRLRYVSTSISRTTTLDD